MLSGEPVADLNGAFVDAGPQVVEHWCDFSQIIQTRKIPALAILSTRVVDQLAPLARDLGLQPAGVLPLMIYTAQGTHRAEGDQYRVERVKSEQGLSEVNRVAASAFNLPYESITRAFGVALLDGPGVSIFLARHNGKVVSVGYTTCAGSLVGIWAMGTLPEHQRKGAGRAVLDYMIADLHQQGAQTFYLWATEAGRPLYDRVGFRTIEEAAVWVLGHSTQVADQ